MVKRNIETNNDRNVKTRTVPVVPVRGRIVRPSDTTTQLQDYVFFLEYIGFNNIDMSQSTGVVLANWGFNLGQKLYSKRTDKRKIDFLKCIIHRAYRVLFLREFDVRCCLRKNKNRNHEHFDIVINYVIFVLREKIRELESVK